MNNQTTTEGDSAPNCIICISPTSDKRIIPFNHKSWERFLLYAEKWRFLEGEQHDLACKFLAKHQHEGLFTQSDPPVREVPKNIGYHSFCYGRFTDKQRVERFESRKRRNKASTSMEPQNAASPENQDSTTEAEKRLLRSNTRSVGKGRSGNVMPNVCVVCCKEEKRIKCPTSLKRKRENLVQCVTIEADRLKTAAKDKCDAQLLVKLEHEDCVAIELKYHKSCYRDYTRYLNPKKGQTTDMDPRYSHAFKNLCEIVRKRILEDKEIFRLTTLNKMFIDEIHASTDLDASGYRTRNLKQRLKQVFPQLCFLTPKIRSQSDIVYVSDIPTASLVEERQQLHECNTMVESETSDDETKGYDTTSGKDGIPIGDRDHHILRDSYMSALALRKIIHDVDSPMSWPPSKGNLSIEAAKSVVPYQLYNFLAWTTGASNEPDHERMVEDVIPDNDRKILAIAQDIMYLSSKGKMQTPKHVSLAMALRHLTGSAQLIGLINGFGYCVSNSVALNVDTAIATDEMRRGDDALPTNIKKGRPTILVWDNNDFGEETLSGHGTTHNTNGIVIQQPDATDQPSSPKTEVSVERTRNRSVNPPPSDIQVYRGGEKKGPEPTKVKETKEQSEAVLQIPRKMDLAYNVTKFDIDGTCNLPGWTGFNHLLSETIVAQKSVIGYLPIIDASPTDMNTVLTILQRSVQIAEKLDLEEIVIVVDQAIYCKAQIIRWQNAEFLKKIILRLGAFHTAMSFLGCIGKRFRDGGLQDILIEAEIIAAGSINSVLTGKHYNRAVRAHKLMSGAMEWMRMDAFLQSVPEHEAIEIKSLVSELQYTFPGDQYKVLLETEIFKQFERGYKKFIQQGEEMATFAYWNSYLEMVEVLLLFLRGIREGNWLLHLASVRCMIPWLFAYDHLNYARYLPAYWQEMMNLPTTHPLTHKTFMDGKFAVQRSSNAFAKIACDQTIEQTANRDSKTKGGMIGFTTNKGAVNKWIWSHHARGEITRECEVMAGKGERNPGRADLQKGRIKRDKADVQRIIETVNSMMNPFLHDANDLVHITSGVVANKEIQHDLLSAHGRGEDEFMKFKEERLETNDISFFHSMKKLQLKTFTNVTSSVKQRTKGKEITIKADRNLLARLVVIGRYRNIDLQELMKYSLGPLPLPLASTHGSLVKTNKANLLHALEEQTENAVTDVPEGCVLIIDGMAFIQQLNTKNIAGPKTFQQLAYVVLQRLLSKARADKASAVHFVTDTYPEVSIKNAERDKRAAQGSQLMKVYGQSLPQQWKKFLSHGKNKEALIEYLFQSWSVFPWSFPQGVKVYLTHGTNCHVFTTDESKNLKAQQVEALQCTQEEADTRMYLHAAFEANMNTKHVAIISPDTDVFIIGTTLQKTINTHLYFQTGRGNNLRTIDLKKVQTAVGDDITKALIGLHCFTGCDSVSAFYGKGKKKALKLLQQNPSMCPAFQAMGQEFDLPPEIMELLEEFTCKLYAQHNDREVNTARYNLFRLTRRSEITMPPNQDALRQHMKRANYQAAIYKRSLDKSPDVPSPLGHGWKMEDGILSIQWMDLPPAPESIMELVNCSNTCRKSKCTVAETCTCVENKIPCTELCKCARLNCNNVTGNDSDIFEPNEEEDDLDSDED